MKIAVSSQNFRTVTAHAGKARRFIVFDLATPCTPREVERLELPRELALHEYRGLDHPLFAMDAVITAAKAGELDSAIEVAKGEDKKPKRKAA